MSHRRKRHSDGVVCFKISDLLLIGLLLCLCFGGKLDLGNAFSGINPSQLLESLVSKSS